MTYVLATTGNIMRWYHIKIDKDGKLIGFDLLERLDQRKVTMFGNRATAKYAALAVELKTWKYVKL